MTGLQVAECLIKEGREVVKRRIGKTVEEERPEKRRVRMEKWRDWEERKELEKEERKEESEEERSAVANIVFQRRRV